MNLSNVLRKSGVVGGHGDKAAASVHLLVQNIDERVRVVNNSRIFMPRREFPLLFRRGLQTATLNFPG